MSETFDAGDRCQVADRQKKASLAAKQADEDFKLLMATPWGRRLMWALLDRCGVFRITFSLAHPDALRLAFSEGERNIGLDYLQGKCLRLTPDEFLAMLKEASASS